MRNQRFLIFLEKEEILIEKMRNVNREASAEEWKSLCKSLKVVEESGSKIIRDGIDKGASNSDVKVEDVDNYFTKFSNFWWFSLGYMEILFIFKKKIYK